MMMWTKSAINSLNSDSEHDNVHQIRTPSPRAVVRDGSGSDAAAAASHLPPYIPSGTPEAIAYQLFLHIVEVEEMYLTLPPTKGKWPAHREWILSTYAQCIRVVRDGKLE
jgi:hypothetical protein